MPRISIQQFRATIADGGARDGVLVNAYRELARRPGLTTAMRGGEWAAWPSAAARRPDLVAAMRTLEWVTWPPAVQTPARA